MENPASWGPAEKVIDQAIRQHEQDSLPEDFYGLSMTAAIAGALRKAGLLIDTQQAGNFMNQNDELMQRLAEVDEAEAEVEHNWSRSAEDIYMSALHRLSAEIHAIKRAAKEATDDGRS